MSKDFFIREVGLTHAAVMAAVHAKAFVDGWSADAMATALAQPGAFALMALQDDETPLGFVLIRAAVFAPVASDGGGGEGEVLTIATHPHARRQGVARALMTTALDKLRAMGVARVFLEVAVDNAPARGVYQSLGFEAVGERKGYYARPGGVRVDALVLAFDL